MDGAAAGGGAFAVLTVISVIGRAAIVGARRQAQRQESERRHREVLAALHARRAPAASTLGARRPPLRPPVLPAGPQDALPESAIVEAARAVVGAEYATVSALQRKLRIEQATAVRLLDALERRGVVGPVQPVLPVRAVLVKPGDWDRLREDWVRRYGAA